MGGGLVSSHVRRIIVPIALLALIAAPVQAAAQGGGHGAIEEYTEQLPGGGGGNPTGDSGDSGDSGGLLTPAQVAALEAEGSEGAKAAKAAQSTGPDRQGGGSDGSGAPAPEGDDGAPLGEVVVELAGGDDSGLGVALPIVLGAALLGALAFVIARRGGGGHTGQA